MITMFVIIRSRARIIISISNLSRNVRSIRGNIITKTSIRLTSSRVRVTRRIRIRRIIGRIRISWNVCVILIMC